jgi:hypothetical protein
MTVSAKGDSTRPVENDGRQFDGCGKCLGVEEKERSLHGVGSALKAMAVWVVAGVRSFEHSCVSVYGVLVAKCGED